MQLQLRNGLNCIKICKNNYSAYVFNGEKTNIKELLNFCLNAHKYMLFFSFREIFENIFE